jgi:hypothetical protein
LPYASLFVDNIVKNVIISNIDGSGSSPHSLTNKAAASFSRVCVPVAQLDRASASGAEG